MTKSTTMIWTVVIILVLLVLGYWIYAERQDGTDRVGFITSFEECADAGYPVTEGFPRECRTPNGEVYKEQTDAEGPYATGGCYVGGCSNTICSDEPGAVSTCEFKPEYACYRTATCGRLADGTCGWLESEELDACLSTNLEELEK